MLASEAHAAIDSSAHRREHVHCPAAYMYMCLLRTPSQTAASAAWRHGHGHRGKHCIECTDAMERCKRSGEAGRARRAGEGERGER